MIAWMLYLTIVGVLVAVGARSAEAMGRALGYPVRWVWAGALVLLVGLAALAPYRVTGSNTRLSLPVAISETSTLPTAKTPSWTALIEARLGKLGAALNAGVKAGAHGIDSRLPKNGAVLVAASSALATFGLLLVFGVIQLRFRRARHSWPVADIHGHRVRVAPNVGPVVIGVARPEIVVPQWLLGRTDHEQRLVVAHEAEHVHARDTLLLGAACVVVAAMPWNPAAWYMLSRLRLTVELDCDARVLRGGAAPFSYGSLLIDVAENNAGFRLSAPALADDSSHLHQRIMAMNATRPKFALARGGALGALALTAVLAACEAKMPTSADVDKMDAASAERVATKLALIKHDSTVYFVDGVKTSEERANLIPADKIATVQVKKSPDGSGTGYIVIRTKNGVDGALAEAKTDSERVEVKRAFAARRLGDSVVVRRRADGDLSGTGLLFKSASATGKEPLIYIDGLKSDPSAIKSLNADRIESVEVIKGAAAASYVNDPDAANGVIVIKTKKM